MSDFAFWPTTPADPKVTAQIRAVFEIKTSGWPILLVPIVASVLLYVYILAFGGQVIREAIDEFGKAMPSASVAIKNIGEYSNAHILWQCASFVFLLASFAAIGVAISQIVRIYSHFGKDVTKPMILALLVIFASFVITVYLITTYGWISGKITELLFTPAETQQLGAVTTDELKTPIQLARLVSTLAFYFLAVASFLIISQIVRETAEPARAATLIAQDIDRLRSILYAGSFCLFTGYFSLHTFIGWRIELLPSDFQSEARNLGDVLIMIWILQWSTALAGIYLLPVLVLFRRAEIQFFRLVASGNADKRDEWLREHGLTMSIGAVALKAFALFGPLALSSEPGLFCFDPTKFP